LGSHRVRHTVTTLTCISGDHVRDKRQRDAQLREKIGSVRHGHTEEVSASIDPGGRYDDELPAYSRFVPCIESRHRSCIDRV
jgi:hypothetical protein